MIDRVSPMTPAKEIARIEHRRRILAQALADEPRGKRAQMNTAELEHLEDQREAWAREQERNRAAWIEHHRRQHRTLTELARRHYIALIKLTQGEGVHS